LQIAIAIANAKRNNKSNANAKDKTIAMQLKNKILQMQMNKICPSENFLRNFSGKFRVYFWIFLENLPKF